MEKEIDAQVVNNIIIHLPSLPNLKYQLLSHIISTPKTTRNSEIEHASLSLGQMHHSLNTPAARHRLNNIECIVFFSIIPIVRMFRAITPLHVSIVINTLQLLEPKVLEDSASSISRKFCYTHI